jgi:hypothetical protein
MPRLASTINRLKNAATNPAPLWQEHIAFLEKKSDGTYKLTGRTPATGYPFFQAGKASDFTILSPEGKFMSAASEYLAVSVK